jgi:hypothetical protein
VTPRVASVLVGAVAGLGLVLRLNGLGFGLPAIYNPDEVAIINRTLSFGTGTLNPGNFLYPTFYFYALFAWQGLTFVAGWLAGAWASLGDFERRYFLDPSAVVWSGRLLSALCGTATIVAVFRLGTLARDRVTGVIAASLMAVAPFAVQDAHYVKHDVPVTLLIVLVPTLLMSGLKHRAIWAGVAAGLAASTHYYAIFVTLIIGVERLAAQDEPWRLRWRSLALAAAATCATFLAASPYLIPEWRTAWMDITQNRAIVMDRATATVGVFGSLGVYLRWLLSDAPGLLVGVVSGVGIMLAARDRPRVTMALLAFPVAFLFFIANTVPATRYLNPVLPFVALFAAWCLRSVGARTGPAAVTTALTLAMMTPGLIDSWALGQFFRRDDTRTVARQWIEANVPVGDTVLLQPYSVPIARSADSLADALRLHLGDPANASVRFQRELIAAATRTEPTYRVLFLGDGGMDVDKRYISPSVVDAAGSLAPVRSEGVEWVVLKQYNIPNPSLAALNQALAREARLVHTVSPYDSSVEDAAVTVTPFEHNEDILRHPALLRPGPTVQIWHLDRSPVTIQ